MGSCEAKNHTLFVYYRMIQMLPLEELYAPPINICVRDNRQFGRKPIVGVHAVKSLQPYRRQPTATDAELDTASKPTHTGQLYGGDTQSRNLRKKRA